jgi:hypothetical protein
MIGWRQNLKVLNTVVARITVNVIDLLIGAESAA